MRSFLTILVASVGFWATAAFAQPNAPPLLINPPPPVVVPPPPVAPAPVPSVVTPLPQPSYGVPPGVTRAPSYGSSVAPTFRYREPAKPRKTKRRPRVSSY